MGVRDLATDRDDFERKLGRMRADGPARGRKYLHRVLAATALAGGARKRGAGSRFHGGRIGRGAAMGAAAWIAPNLLEAFVPGVPWLRRGWYGNGYLSADWSGTGKFPILKFVPALVFDPGGFADVLKVAADIARLREIKTANALRGLGVSVVLHIPDQAGPPCLG